MTASPPSRTPSIPEFWRLVVQSGLFQEEQCRDLHKRFSEEGGSGPAAATKPLAKWLIERKYLTLYQVQVLLTGRPGPFIYGDYKLLERVQEGKLQGCFRAVHMATRYPVVLQFFAGSMVEKPALWASLVPWLNAVCAIRDVHVQRWFQWVDLGNFKFLVSEQLSGETLEDLLGRGPVKSPRACWLIQQAARGVEFVHQWGWSHGHLRPDTIWVTPSHGVKLLLHPLSQATSLAAPDERVVADYRAPELSLSGASPHPTTDVYALGCLLYQLLAGRPPFPGGTLDEKARRHSSEPLQSLAHRKVKPELEQLVGRMMAKNPEARLHSMAEVIRQLEAFVEDEPHLMPPGLPDRTRDAYEATLPPIPSPASSLPRPAAAHPITIKEAVPTKTPRLPTADDRAASPGSPVSGPLGDLQKIAEAERSGRRVAPRPNAKTNADKKSHRVLFAWIGGAAVLVVGLFITVWILLFANREPGPAIPPSPVADATSPDRDGSSVKGAGVQDRSRSRVIPDDGQSLWASPTTGSTLDLRGVPPDSLLTIVLRPAAIFGHSEGARSLRALGPVWEQVETSFRERVGVPWEDVEQVVLSLHDRGSDWARPALSVRLREARPLSELLAGWGHPTASTDGKAIYAVGESTAYHCWNTEAAESDEGGIVRAFSWGPVEEVELVAERGGAAPVAPAGAEPLLRNSDSERMLSILFVPSTWQSNLLRDGREFYFGEPSRLREFLDWLIGDGMRAGLLSLHLGSESAYFDLQLVSTELGARPLLASRMRERLEQLPDLTEAFIATQIQPREYWIRVAFRFPLMIRFLLDQTRVQVEDERIVLNVLLPLEAPHNLLFASEMLLASPRGTTTAAIPVTAAPPTPATLEAVLRERMSLRFDQLALEAALAAVVSDVRENHPRLSFEFDVKIVGDDFEKGGITRNQQIVGFDQRDVTVADVLTALVQRANPITTVKSPSELDQKLIWVIAPDPDRPTRTIILLTTREGAASRSWELPQVFQAAE